MFLGLTPEQVGGAALIGCGIQITIMLIQSGVKKFKQRNEFGGQFINSTITNYNYSEASEKVVKDLGDLQSYIDFHVSQADGAKGKFVDIIKDTVNLIENVNSRTNISFQLGIINAKAVKRIIHLQDIGKDEEMVSITKSFEDMVDSLPN